MKNITVYTASILKTGKTHTSLLLGLLVLISSCSNRYYPVLPDAPPIKPFIPSEVKLNYIAPPPMVLPDNIMSTRSFPSQLFKIGIVDCIDKTGGKASEVITPLAEMINTAISETKRFELVDKGEIIEIEKFSLKRDLFNYQLTSDTVKRTQDSGIVSLKNMKVMEAQNNYKVLVDRLRDKCDGVLVTTITSIVPSPYDSRYKIMGLDCKIISTGLNKGEGRGSGGGDEDYVVLYANSYELRLLYEKSTESIKPERQDLNKIAEDIKQYFPNPDLQDDLHITTIREKTITVNAGKHNNVNKGMMGFVIKMHEDKEAYDCRAVFRVTEVFPEAFNAQLLVEQGHENEDKMLISQIKVGEPIKMK